MKRKNNKHGFEKRGVAGLLIVSMLFTSVSWLPFSITSEAESRASEEITEEITGLSMLEGISLDKSNLVMQTGEQKTLQVSLKPADLEETPEITWSSDDENVVQVKGDGLKATIVAPEGGGGTATVTVKAGEFTAQCRVLVTVKDPMLESLLFMQNSSGSNLYELTEEGVGSREYTLRIPETTNVAYVRPQLRDDIYESATITAKFQDAVSGEEKEIELPVDETTSLSSVSTGRLIKAYNTEKRELEIEVEYEGQKETYRIHVVRGTYLGNFTLTDEKGSAVEYSPAFDKTTYRYSLHVPSSTKRLKLQMQAYEKTSTVLTVNGNVAENGSYTLELNDNKTKAVLSAGDGKEAKPFEYVLTVYVDEICYLTAVLEPAEAVLSIYDENKVQIDPVEGKYELLKGGTYTYTVSAPGYKTENGSFTTEGDEEKIFTLEKNNSNQPEEVDSEWGGYWKNENNQNVVDAQTPSSLESAEVAWKQQYGKSADVTNSISDGILVENYVCCFQGNQLLYLNKETGETEKSVQMSGKGNSTFNKPLYAAGMIFVPLNNGRVQAFNAKTLEPLWLYEDTVGGMAATALRYDSGYLYVGFADGNLVCLSIEDENPEKKDEAKSAVWRKYDSEGFYRTGIYTDDIYAYACGRSGTLYCLNKKTGETVQQITVPQEAGAPSTAICFEKGRIYFATENGWLYSYALAENGKIREDSVSSIRLGGVIYGTPLIYKGRVYVGSGAKDVYGVVRAPYNLNVVQVGTDGSLSLTYQMEIGGCPKGSGTLTTAYEQQDGFVYLYYTTDTSQGKIYLLKDQAGLTEPGKGSGLFYQQNDTSGNGGSSILADQAGNLYFRYESAWFYKLKASPLFLKNVEVSGEESLVDGGAVFDGQAESHKILLTPDSESVSLRLEISEGAEAAINGVVGTEREIFLKDGMAEATVVLSKDGQTRTYYFSIRSRSRDASLKNIQVSYSAVVNVMEMELEPAFEKEQTEYRSSIYGNKDMQIFYVWPVLEEESGSTMKMTVVSGVKGMRPGEEIEGMEVWLDTGPRLRYKVPPVDTTGTVVALTVTAEDGVTTKTYQLTLERDNTLPGVTAGAGAVVNREKHSVTLKVNAAINGYLYYLPDRKEGTAGMPTSSEIKTNGQRLAVSAGENLVMLEGVPEEESVIYLYEMSYAQRFSNGILVEVPAYTGQTDPDPSTPSGKGDVNGDGVVNLQDAIFLLNALTAGKNLSAETADINGDGMVTLQDAIGLLNQITGGTG